MVCGLNVEAHSSDLKKGDALLLKAKVEMLGDHEILVRGIDSNSITFWQVVDGKKVQRLWPVRPSEEPLENPAYLDFMDKVERTFVFTKATQQSGAFKMMAEWDTGTVGAKKERVGKIWSEAIEYTVQEEVSFSRTANGLISQEDAERLARNFLGVSQDTSCESHLIPSIHGLKDWAVRVHHNGGEVTALLINPYLGSVRTVDEAGEHTKEEVSQ